jgi:hypothetical protein
MTCGECANMVDKDGCLGPLTHPRSCCTLGVTERNCGLMHISADQWPIVFHLSWTVSRGCGPLGLLQMQTCMALNEIAVCLHSLYRGLKKTELFWQSALFPQMFLWQTLNTAMIHSQNSVSTQWASQLLAWRLSSLPHVLGAGEGQRWLLFLSPLLDLSSNPACTYFRWKFTPNLGRERQDLDITQNSHAQGAELWGHSLSNGVQAWV